MGGMRTEDAVTILQQLIDQSGLGEEPGYLEWEAKAQSVLRPSSVLAVTSSMPFVTHLP